MATPLTLVADFETTLASGVAAAATTATLVDATDDDGIALPTGTYAFTIDKDVRDTKEYIVCTLTGTAITAVQSVTRQGVKTTGFARAHRYGAKVSITDWSYLSELGINVGKVVALSDAATIVIDASRGSVFDVTLEGNRTLGAPTNPTDGQTIQLRIKQDATGSRTLAYNGVFGFTATLPSPTLTTTPGKIDFIDFQYKLADLKWFVQKINKGG